MDDRGLLLTMWTNLSGSLWASAVEHVCKAEVEARLPIGTPVDAEMAHAAAAIVMSTCTAEGVINEFLLGSGGPPPYPGLSHFPYIRHIPTRRKWAGALNMAGTQGDPRIDTHIERLNLLFNLRNMLVHYVPEERAVYASGGIFGPRGQREPDEQALVGDLQKHGLQLSGRCPNNPLLHQVLGGGGARWASTTVLEATIDLHSWAQVNPPFWTAQSP